MPPDVETMVASIRSPTLASTTPSSFFNSSTASDASPLAPTATSATSAPRDTMVPGIVWPVCSGFALIDASNRAAKSSSGRSLTSGNSSRSAYTVPARMAFHLDVPPDLQRNSKAVTDIGIEETGLTLLDLATQRLGLTSLAESDVLDIGCGVRFAQTIVNRGVAIRSYTGIEVYRPIVDFMRDCLEPHDPRFRFVHWDVQNGLFNNDASSRRLIDEPALPVTSTFDVIWLYSVFTHLDRDDARAMLRLTRQVIRPTGALLFTAFVDPEIEGVESRSEVHPLMMVFYGLEAMKQL